MSSLTDLLATVADRVLGALGAAPLRARRSPRLSENWRRLAERARFEVVESSPRGIVARLGGLTVRVPAMTFTWPDVPGVAVVALPGKRARVPTRGTGDGNFDRSFDVLGPDATVRALLDYQTRDDLCALLEVLRGEVPTLPGKIAHRLARSGQGLVRQRGQVSLEKPGT